MSPLKKYGLNRSHLFIFLRALTIVLLTNMSIYFIASERYLGAVALNVAISAIWTYNIRDLSVSSKLDRLSYIAGGGVGVTIALYGLRLLFKS
jgi:hypothetical protein